MNVKISLDEYGILNECEFDIVIKKSASSISSARKEIVKYLSSNNSGQLFVLIKSRSVLTRISDLLSLNNVSSLYESNPRAAFEEKVGFSIPSWLDNNVISALNILDFNLEGIREEFLLNDLLNKINLKFFEKRNFHHFIKVVFDNAKSFYILIKVKEFNKQVVNFLTQDLALANDGSLAFISLLEGSIEIKKDLKFISEQQALHHLKNISTIHNLPLALPPLEIPSEITQLPLVNHYFCDTRLAEKFVNMLELLFSREEHYNNDELLIKCIPYLWPKLIIALEKILKAQPSLITHRLIQYLQSFESQPCIDLVNGLEAKLQLSSLKAISETDEIQSVVDWTYDYFDLIKQSFESNNLDYETELASSFSDWLIAQKARVERSKFDWRHVSRGIEESLLANDITVVFMVDALSQIHHKTIKTILNCFENLTYNEKVVFAPLPTLTKIGKKSILTGFNPSKTSKSDRDILLEKYSQFIPSEKSFLFLQDWKRARNSELTSDTKFVVVYINELDDRLHKTPSFSKHCNDATQIIKSIKKTIEKWLKDTYVLNKSISFIITADHGVTSLNTVEKNIFDNKCGERVVELLTPQNEIPDNFYHIPGYNNHGYIVPKKRASFDKQVALSHGGITPEEVLIPFIELKNTNYLHDENHFTIQEDRLDCILESENKWIIKVHFSTYDKLTNILLRCQLPFSGSYKMKQLDSRESLLIPLQISSKHGQQGMTEIDLTVQYTRNNENLERKLTLVVDIPKPLLKETDISKSFGAMFDL